MEGDPESPGETPFPSPVPAWELPDAPPVTYNWVDITEEMKAACDELLLGELIHEPKFGLLEAMSAIEMMDPKMDAGMVGKQTKRKILGFQQAIEVKTIKIADLSHEELIGIMDQSLCCLVSWLEGQTLAQTVFTCLYLHDPNLIEDRCLRAYSLCMLKLCDVIREKVNKANVFEEEDFQTASYGFKLAENLTDMRVVGMMKEMEDEYGRKRRSAKSKQASGDEAAKFEATLYDAVLARIRFLKLFLQCVKAFGKKAESLQVKKELNIMLEHLNTIGSSIHLGIESVQSDDGHQIMHGFEPLVNQKLLPPTFPRYTTLRSRNEIHDQYTQIVKRFLTVTEVTSLSGFQNILEFMDKFGQTVPCVLSRSLLQLTFLPESRKVFGHQLLADCVKDSLKAFNSPPIFSPRCLALLSNPQAKSSIDLFLQRASRVATSLVQAYGHNRARHREKLATLLEDLASLQEESERLDAQLHTIYMSGDHSLENSHISGLSGWTTYYTLKVMIQYLYSGFELELYSPHEMHYIYWYLAEVLYAWSSTIINRAELSIARDEALAEMQGQTKGRNSKKAKKNKKKIRVHMKELQMLQGYQNMASGCFKAIIGFFLGRRILNPGFVLDSECTRYEHRFLPFVNITTPPFLLYNQFREMTDLNHYRPKPAPEHLYQAAARHFGQVKDYFESLHNPTEEMQKFGKVAKTNLVVMKLLAIGHKKDSTSKMEFDFSVHKCFPIFKIT